MEEDARDLKPMNVRILHAFIIACIAVGCLCGCHESGKWENDRNNWKRAFGVSPPKDLKVLHSIYWRTPHFTREDGWTFHIQSAPRYYKEWLAAYKVKNPNAEELKALEPLKQDKPSWFLPKPMTEYEVWVISGEPHSSFALFVDRSTGEWFVTDSGF